MGILSALSSATRWLLKRDPEDENPITKGIELMSTFKESGERMDALVTQIKEQVALRDASAKAAVDADAKRLELERELMLAENERDAVYDNLVAFIATLSPLPQVVRDSIAKAEEEARLAAEAEAARIAEEARLKAEAEAAEAARVAEEQRLAEEAARLEAERIAAEQAAAAEAQRLADEAEAARLAEEARIAAEAAAQAEAERLATEQAAADEAARLAAEQASPSPPAEPGAEPQPEPAPADSAPPNPFA